ncbi:hypothetical protein MRBLMR1_005901 [Neorhizobium sp. LMR1-1-1.1]
MLGSEAVKCEIFNRVNGSADRKLAHPTSSDWDVAVWNTLVTDDEVEMSDRNLSLISAGLIIGANQTKLRESCFPFLFPGLSKLQIGTFAIADANRSWSILREKGLEAQRQQAARSEAVYSGLVGRLKVEAGPIATPGGVDVLNMTVVDCVPHWLFLASTAPDSESREGFDYAKMGPAAQYILSIEHVLKEVWHQVFWEPWSFGKEDEDFWTAKPNVPADRALWSAWGWRDENLMFQDQMVRAHFGGQRSVAQDHAINKTATAYRGTGASLEITITEPSDERRSIHEGAMITIESSYLGELLDEPISQRHPDITLRLLARAVAVLQDLAEVLLPPTADTEYATENDIDRIACGVPGSQIALLLEEALVLSPGQAETILSHLVSSPFEDMTALFRNGLWHRPLVSLAGDGTLYLLVGALIWGSPVRRLERWLQEGVSKKQNDDLSKTPLGIKYEALVREKLALAIHSNELFQGVSSGVASIPKNQAKEEVDGLFRIGSTVFVLEVKCFLSPSEPRERYNYLKKLEKACAQASRKAEWLRLNPQEAEKYLGPLPGYETMRFVPLVVVNQSTGSGFRVGDCAVIDAHFLRLYLTSGSYRSGGAVDFTEENKFGFAHQTLYTSAEEAEQVATDVFSNHPGLRAYLASVMWETVEIPLLIEGAVHLWSPSMDSDAYMRTLPDPNDLLASV